MSHILKKLKSNQFGFDHIFLVIGFVVLVGVIGTAYIAINNAESAGFSLQVYRNDSGYCLDNYNGLNNRVDLYSCDSKTTQSWSFSNSSNNFEILSASGYCLKGSGSDAVLAKCPNTSTSAFTWSWVNTAKISGTVGRQLRNSASSKCLDDSGGSDKNNTTIDMYGCKSPGQGPDNQEWWEDPVNTATTQTTLNAKTKPPVVSTKITTSTNPATSLHPTTYECPTSVVNGNTFSTSTPAGDYTNCIVAIQEMANGIHAAEILQWLLNTADGHNGGPSSAATFYWGGGSFPNSMLIINGDYTAATAQAIKYVQAVAGVTPSGVVGKQTYTYFCESGQAYSTITPITYYTNNLQDRQAYSSFPTYAYTGYQATAATFGANNTRAAYCELL